MIDYHNTMRIAGCPTENEEKFPDIALQRNGSRYRLHPHEYFIIQLTDLALSDICKV